MRGRLFTLLSAVSLLLSAATCALWAMSYNRLLEVRHYETISFELVSNRGQFVIDDRPFRLYFDTDLWNVRWEGDYSAEEVLHYYRDITARETVLRFGLILRQALEWRSTITMPHAAPAILFAILPICWVRAYRRKCAHDPLQCRSCGYDLRTTPGRCPECGIEPVAVHP